MALLNGVNDPHDAVVLAAAKLASPILRWVSRQEFWGEAADALLKTVYHVEFEYEFEQHSFRDDKGIVDIALTVDGIPKFSMEIKSKAEAQSASAWHRQTRYYSRLSGAPCLLVVAHDLGEIQKQYLDVTGTVWLDLRKLCS